MNEEDMRWRHLEMESDDDQNAYDIWVPTFLEDSSPEDKFIEFKEWLLLFKILCIGFLAFVLTELGIRANALIKYDLCSLVSHAGHSDYASFEISKAWSAVVNSGELALSLLNLEVIKSKKDVLLKSYEWYVSLGSWTTNGTHSVFEGPWTGQKIGRYLITRYLEDYERDQV